jgi:sugar transferase (PEP-CTERM/EpsH1 system associated)
VKILFLSQRVPYPPNRGDKITTWRLVERMQRAHHDVRVVAFAHGPADEQAARTLIEKGIPTTAVPYHDGWKKLASLPLLLTRTPLTLGVYGSHALQRHVDREIAACDMAYAYSSSMGAFLEKHDQVPRVMHFGELDSDKWRQYAERASFPMSWVYGREQRTLLEFERRIAAHFTDNVLCTPLEQAIFHEQIGAGVHSTVLRNGVDLQHFTPAATPPEPGHIAFTGVMNYFPNVDGCIWFAREILPRIQARVPAARFTIVGAHPTEAVRRLAQLEGVTVTGFVDDTRDWLCRAAVAVAPLRIARGIQNKVLEAMAMGLPVVGTTAATQGVEGQSERDYLVRDDPASFADAVIGLLDEPLKARAIGAGARAFVEANYDWEVVFRPLDDILERCRAAGAGRR